jgi:hypothetical protein
VKKRTAGHSKKEKKNPWKEFDFFLLANSFSLYLPPFWGKKKKEKRKRNC